MTRFTYSDHAPGCPGCGHTVPVDGCVGGNGSHSIRPCRCAMWRDIIYASAPHANEPARVALLAFDSRSQSSAPERQVPTSPDGCHVDVQRTAGLP
jgi:hypothetical protein